MSENTLVADIEEFVRKSEDRMLRVMQASIQDVIERSQLPVAKGGQMRVDTGFLRASGRAKIGSYAIGPDERPKDAVAGQFTWDGEAVGAVLISMKLGDTFTFGWTANYARKRELYDGFMNVAIQNWQIYVDRNVEKLRKEIG